MVPLLMMLLCNNKAIILWVLRDWGLQESGYKLVVKECDLLLWVRLILALSSRVPRPHLPIKSVRRRVVWVYGLCRESARRWVTLRGDKGQRTLVDWRQRLLLAFLRLWHSWSVDFLRSRCIEMATCINVCFLVFSLALLPRVPVRAEMFTALVHMEGLVALEKELLAGLESYLQVERER